MGVRASSTVKQLLRPHCSLLMSTATSPISSCPSLFVFLAVHRCISLKVQRNLWHFKIWISKVPDFGCQEWRGVSSPNSCLTEADSLPAVSLDQVWQASTFEKKDRPKKKVWPDGQIWGVTVALIEKQGRTRTCNTHSVFRCWFSPSEGTKAWTEWRKYRDYYWYDWLVHHAEE